MFLSAGEIDTSIHWLLENVSSPVKYLVYRHVLKADLQSESMQARWRDVERSREADEIAKAITREKALDKVC